MLVAALDNEEREKRVTYTSVAANAIMLQNVVDLTRILKELKAEGLEYGPDDVAALSPYLTRHIRRFGDYSFDLGHPPAPLGDDEVTFTL